MNLIPIMGIGDFFNTIMWPFRAAVSGLLVIFYKVLSPLFGADSGVTWALAIVLLTIVMRLAMVPMFLRQMESSRVMQTLQPKLKELQKKYGGDRERLGQETMALYKSEGANPMSSCLPLLVQMPIFLGLFQVLNAAARGNTGDSLGFFFQKNLDLVESLQNSTVFGAKLAGTFLPINDENPFGATQIFCIVMIVLMMASLFAQQLMTLRLNTPPAALEGPMGQQQKMMLYVFPLIYAFTGISIPIGVLVYWLSTNLWSLGQTYVLMRNVPTPDTPAYLVWEDRMRKQGKDPRAIERERTEKRRERVAKKQAKREGSLMKEVEARAAQIRAAENIETADSDSSEAPARERIVGRQQPVSQSRAQRKAKSKSKGGYRPKKK